MKSGGGIPFIFHQGSLCMKINFIMQLWGGGGSLNEVYPLACPKCIICVCVIYLFYPCDTFCSCAKSGCGVFNQDLLCMKRHVTVQLYGGGGGGVTNILSCLKRIISLNISLNKLF